MKRLPQDITNLLTLCIRNIIWYKEKILSFFEDSGVPKSILLIAKRNIEEPTFKLVPIVLEELYQKGDEGFLIAKKMLTKIYYWKDIHSVPNDRKDDAIKALKELQNAYKTYEAQQQYESEKKSQIERENRLNISKLDHSKLQEFRDRFDKIYFHDQQKRGNEYEKLMNDIFKYYFPTAFQGFKRMGEQIDGQFYFDGHWYYIEVRWKQGPASAADISILRDRARQGFAGDVRAVFISYNGFSEECIKSLTAGCDERVILLTGYDLRSVLECEIALDILLHKIQAFLVRNKKAYVSANEIIQMENNFE